jgi:hypothetical protein
MALTHAQLITYIEPLIVSEIFVPCAAATDAATGQALFKEGLAKVIADAIKHYNDNVFPDAEVTPTGSVTISTRVNPELL